MAGRHVAFWLPVLALCCDAFAPASLQAARGGAVSRKHLYCTRAGAHTIACVLKPPKEGSVAVQGGQHELWYQIHRPMSLSSQQGVPLLVLHGGPQVPSDYLFDLAKVDYRSVVFYDQLGCGRSAAPEPGETTEYSIPASVRDLADVIKALGLRKYHLLGQSWGGILGYEFLRSGCSEAAGCQSFIISNTPTSVARVEAEAAGMVDALGGEARADISEAFSRTHECRLPTRPQLLVDAYAHAGSIWRGTSAIKTWALDTSESGASKIDVPTMVLRGEFDFVTDGSVQGWKEAFSRTRYKCVPDASHHTLLEATDDYIEIVDNFLAEYD